MSARRNWRRRRTWIASAAAVLALGLLPFEGSDPHLEPQHPHTLTRAHDGRAGVAYDRWRLDHEAAGGDRQVLVALGTSRGHRSSLAGVGGVARIDLIGGRAVIDMTGLGDDGAWDAWLVDNVDAPDAGALLDPGDRRLLVGRLGPLEDGRRHVDADFGEGALDAFEVDLVVVTAADAPDEAVAFGLPSAFQRLYTRARLGRLEAYAEGPRATVRGDTSLAGLIAGALGPGRAHAAGVVVDTDVILDAMVAQGAELFINETFAGNGRTCATCHPASNNFTLDPLFISRLPPDDPLFVAETNPALAALEVPELLRSRALILENLDGFDKPGVLRSVPHTLAMTVSLTPPTCIDPEGCDIPLPDGGVITIPFGVSSNFVDGITPEASGFPPLSLDPFIEFPLERTGWSGDGAPGGGTLREFAIGAIIQHFPQRLDRVAGVDFRLPSDEELDALEAFQLSLGRSADLDLETMVFNDPIVERGREIFNTVDTQGGTAQAGKCIFCHANAGALSTPDGFGDLLAQVGVSREFVNNGMFDTGVGDQAVIPADLIAPGAAPRDAGFGIRPQGPDDCVDGHFDFSQGFPLFIPNDQGGAGGFGTPAPAPFLPAGLCQELFNTPPLVEAADTPPFFHDNSVDTLEQAIAFYNSDAFNRSPPIQLFIQGSDSGGIGIRIDASAVTAIAGFLRVLNAIENLRQATGFDLAARDATVRDIRDQLITRALDELEDAHEVLFHVKLHPHAISKIQQARAANAAARLLPVGVVARQLLDNAVAHMDDARIDMVELVE